MTARLLLCLMTLWLVGATTIVSRPPAHGVHDTLKISELQPANLRKDRCHVVTDPDSASDCSTGDGTGFVNICCSNGTTWLSMGAAAAAGEANTGSNLGGGLANFSTKVGVDLRFNSFAAADFDLGSNLITIDKAASPVWTGDHDFGGGGIEIENNAALPVACTVGQIFLDTNETSGQQLFGCEGGSFVLQGDGGGTHDILSATHTDTLPVAVTRGGIIIGNVTPVWSKLNVGAVNLVHLVNNGTDVFWSDSDKPLFILEQATPPSVNGGIVIDTDGDGVEVIDDVLTFRNGGVNYNIPSLRTFPTSNGHVIALNRTTDQYVWKPLTSGDGISIASGATSIITNMVTEGVNAIHDGTVPTTAENSLGIDTTGDGVNILHDTLSFRSDGENFFIPAAREYPTVAGSCLVLNDPNNDWEWSSTSCTAGGAAGTVNTIKENDVQVGGSDIVTLDFLGADFDLAESPDTEIQIVIAAAIARDSELHAQSHVLATGTALGPDHTMSGATAGDVLRALSATTAAFDVLQHDDLGGVTTAQHHTVFSPNADPGVDHSALAGGDGITETGGVIATASSEENFLTSGALTCGAGTAGKMQTHTTALQYCDNTATPILRFAAYGGSGGLITDFSNAADLNAGGTVNATHSGTAHHVKTIDASELSTGIIPAARVGADHIDAMSEIAAAIKRGPDATDTHLLTTDVAAPGGLTCLNMDTDGSVVLAAGACAAAGGGDVSDVGPGCATGACWTNAVTTTGTTMWIWEGTIDNLDEFTFTVPADPDFDITWVQTQSTEARTITFQDATGTVPVDTVALTTLRGPGLQNNGSILQVASEEAFFLEIGTIAAANSGALVIDSDGNGTTYDNPTLNYQELAQDLFLFGVDAYPSDVDNVCMVYDTTLDRVEWSTASCVAGGGTMSSFDITDTDASPILTVNDAEQIQYIGGTAITVVAAADAANHDVTFSCDAATATTTGCLEQATQAEADAGTAGNLAVIASVLEAWNGGSNIVTVGTITTGVWNGTALLDAAVDDGITVSNYLLLAGGVLTGEVTIDGTGLAAEDTDELANCTTFPATGGGIFYDGGGAGAGVWKKCTDNVLTDLDTAGAEANDLEAVVGSVLTNEVFVGSGTSAGAYIAIPVCSSVQKLQYTDAAPNTFTCVADNDTQPLTTEAVEDIAGALVANATGTHTGIAITYQDATGDMDFIVDHDGGINFVADEHVAHTGVVITAGTGLTGGGNIATSFTIDAAGGDGIIANANDLAVDLNATIDGTGPATSSLSGLEFTATNELALLQACANNDVLKWVDAGATWDCAADEDTGGAPALSAITDPVGDVGFIFDDGEEIVWTMTSTGPIGTDVFHIDFDQPDDADATDDIDVWQISLSLESGDAGDTIRAMKIVLNDGVANTILDAGWQIINDETTAGTIIDAIRVLSPGVDGGIIDAIDASAANIDNALNMGANNIVTGSATISGGEMNILDGGILITEITTGTKANLESILSDVADLAEADGDTYSGTHNYGGSVAHEIPNSGAPAITIAGQLAQDNSDVPTVDGRAQLVMRDGGDDLVFLAVKTACFDIEDLVAADDDYAIWSPPYAVEILGGFCYCNGTCTVAGTVHFEKNRAGVITQIGGASTTGDIACSNSSSATETLTDLTAGTLTLASFDQLRFDTITAPTATNTMNICWTYAVERQ